MTKIDDLIAPFRKLMDHQIGEIKEQADDKHVERLGEVLVRALEAYMREYPDINAASVFLGHAGALAFSVAASVSETDVEPAKRLIPILCASLGKYIGDEALSYDNLGRVGKVSQ